MGLFLGTSLGARNANSALWMLGSTEIKPGGLLVQEAVMQAVHVLNTVTVPMGLQMLGLDAGRDAYDCECNGWYVLIDQT